MFLIILHLSAANKCYFSKKKSIILYKIFNFKYELVNYHLCSLNFTYKFLLKYNLLKQYYKI